MGEGREGQAAGPLQQAQREVGDRPGQQEQQAQTAVDAAGLLLLGKLLQEVPPPQPPEEPKRTVPDEEANAALARQTEQRSWDLTLEHGVRPRRYAGFIGGASNDAQREFRDALPVVTSFLNDALAASGSKLRVSEAELAANFIAECAPMLQHNVTSGATVGTFGTSTGFQLDMFISSYASTKRWLPPELRAKVEHAINTNGVADESGAIYEIDENLTIAEGLSANAGMYVSSMQQLSRDLAQRKVALATLSAPARMFWTTVYFNAGAGTGRKLLDAHGVDFYKQPWQGDDDPAVSSSAAAYNAHVRTASFELLNTGNPDGRIALPEAVTAPPPTRQMTDGDLVKEAESMAASVGADFARLPITDPVFGAFERVLKLIAPREGSPSPMPDFDAQLAYITAINTDRANLLQILDSKHNLFERALRRLGGAMPNLRAMSFRQVEEMCERLIDAPLGEDQIAVHTQVYLLQNQLQALGVTSDKEFAHTQEQLIQEELVERARGYEPYRTGHMVATDRLGRYGDLVVSALPGDVAALRRWNVASRLAVWQSNMKYNVRLAISGVFGKPLDGLYARAGVVMPDFAKLSYDAFNRHINSLSGHKALWEWWQTMFLPYIDDPALHPALVAERHTGDAELAQPPLVSTVPVGPPKPPDAPAIEEGAPAIKESMSETDQGASEP